MRDGGRSRGHVLLICFLAFALASSGLLLLSSNARAYPTNIQKRSVGNPACSWSSGILGNYGSSAEYSYNAPASSDHPQFFAAVEGHTACATTIRILKVTATGTYPDGSNLPGNRFTALDAFSSPEQNGAYNDLLWKIFGELAKIDPTGISSSAYSLTAHAPSVTTTGADALSAWGTFQAGTFDQPDSKGLWFSFQLAVEPSKPGKYTLRLVYHIEYMRTNCPTCIQDWYRADLTDNLDYCYLRCNPGQTNNAQFFSHTMPSYMSPGQTLAVEVVMKNTGQTTWWPYDRGSYTPRFCSDCFSLYRLGSLGGDWGVSRVELTRPTLPGQAATFSFTVTAPMTTGTRSWQWRMVQEVNPGTGVVEWFGVPTPNVQVTIGSPDFTISSCGYVSLAVGGVYTTCAVSLKSLAFVGTVTLSASLSPVVDGGPTISLSPTSVSLSMNGQGSATLTIVSGSAEGQFTITVRGTSGSLAHSTTISLTIAVGGGGRCPPSCPT